MVQGVSNVLKILSGIVTYECSCYFEKFIDNFYSLDDSDFYIWLVNLLDLEHSFATLWLAHLGGIVLFA